MPDDTPVENPSRTSFSVTSASGATYQADLASGSCDCADAEYRPLAGTSTFAVTFETDSVVVEIGDRCLVLNATSLPESGVVMGFGYVGIELVPYLAEAGVDVTVIEHDARPLDDAPPAFGDELLSLYREAFDVEVVRDGRYATGSLRNHDRVVFVNRSSGEVNESLSLGADDDHSILGEQHNADYIPDERGGPATIVADSNNDRIVESQREDGEWVSRGCGRTISSSGPATRVGSPTATRSSRTRTVTVSSRSTNVAGSSGQSRLRLTPTRLNDCRRSTRASATRRPPSWGSTLGL
jgi:hypothetical protein